MIVPSDLTRPSIYIGILEKGKHKSLDNRKKQFVDMVDKWRAEQPYSASERGGACTNKASIVVIFSL